MLRLCCTLVFLLGLGHASQIFSNKGTTQGWSHINQENKGTVQQVSNVFIESPSAIKCTQVYDPSYAGRYHSDLRKDNIYRNGDTGFYGFAFRLQEDWDFSGDQSYNIAQFIADFTDSGCDDWMPTTMIWLQGNQLYTRVKHGTVCPKAAQLLTVFPKVATVSAGQWHKIVVHSSWKSDNTGFFKLWFDGVKVLEQFNIPTTIDNNRAFGFSIGLYANAWGDEGRMEGSQGTRQVWFDEIGVGSAFADADLDQW
ncbi:polysaccharide lyase family 20 protein [Macroventuria anomochaeta]|uniref:Polysaccharide lyase family 20 protein n=1 Tax=Macroventuria anomochaeta TaxID=301207 RepID=A0ACB6RKI6_9PLEO|nr:polysaccharide lyase family 20 protein [Macroventuria anomochaeta]KAF2621487.1 polysaccharide lyase family 20 protein [Macroventuria anomochaeta]